MYKIFLVKANFSDFESSWSKTIGVFSSKEEADKNKTKWVRFFEHHKDIFDEPNNWEPSEEDYEWEIEDWKESEEYFSLRSKYSLLHEYDDITIEEIPLDVDIFNEGKYLTESISSLMVAWNRDYKINEII